MDNLNYYSAWLPAWQLTDKYSSQPWCLKSKNLDIFSSSKSVKATAWTDPVTTDSQGIIAQDDKGRLQLKTDWKVWDSRTNTLVVDPSANFPSYDVSYIGNTAAGYASAIWGTPMDMLVKYEWDTWKTIIVYTDRNSFTYTSEKITLEKAIWNINNLTMDTDLGRTTNGYLFTKTSSSGSSGYIDIKLPEGRFCNVNVKIKATQYDDSDTDISLEKIVIHIPRGYYYDAEMDAVVPTGVLWDEIEITQFDWSITDEGGLTVTLPAMPLGSSNGRRATIRFKFTQHEGVSNYPWSWELYVDFNSLDYEEALWSADTNYFYSYLPLGYREKVEVWEYYWTKSQTFQVFYQRVSYRITRNWQKVTVYDLEQYMWWANDPAMDVIGMTVWNEQVYMIWNLNGNGYIIPCDLSGGRWTPFVAYWCQFTWVVNIDYLLYLVWEDRWISNLWVFNQQELVPILWGKLESQYTDLIGVDEPYKFDGNLVNWRKNLILSTSDNRIFQYGQTYGGKWGTFIHTLPSEAVITKIKANKSDLEVNYSITTTSWWVDTTVNYVTKYQDDTPIKRYNTIWEAVYPIVLGNHILEKEESDLYVSYILPNASCSLEFWGMANHYHFWTFSSSDNATIDPTGTYKIKWTSWTYSLKFLEKNDDQYTFRLEWDLPVQTTGEMKIINSSNAEVLSYTSFNHFRKIWSITTTEYQEWDFRFHNLNNKLELPKSHSLQIMVKGKGTTNYTPELFALDLVANQRDRW